MSPKLLNLLLLISSGALYYLFITPLYTGSGTLWSPSSGGITQLKVKKAEYQVALSQADQFIEKAKALKKEFSSVTEKDLAEMSIMVPESVDRVRLLSEITKMIEDYSLPIKEVSVGEGKISGDIGEVSVSFQISATYPRFKEVINYFDYSKRLYAFDSVMVSAPKEMDEPMNFDVRLRTFYLR